MKRKLANFETENHWVYSQDCSNHGQLLAVVLNGKREDTLSATQFMRCLNRGYYTWYGDVFTKTSEHKSIRNGGDSAVARPVQSIWSLSLTTLESSPVSLTGDT